MPDINDDDIKPVDGPVPEFEPETTYYCRAYDGNRNVLGCTAKSSESACQDYAQAKSATYYSYTSNSC